MKKLRKRLSALALAVLTACVLAAPALAGTQPTDTLTVLFTHDTHDHFYPDAADVGGYARLATALENARAAAGNTATVTVDAGDFSMGSFFQTVYATDAPELRALGYMGYDVVTFGNHEYDYRPQGLADMLNAAKEAQEAYRKAMAVSYAAAMEKYTARYGPATPNLPAIVQANYVTPKDPSDPASQAAVEAMKNYPVTDYTIIERGGMKIAVFGVMGVDSDECAPMSGMTLEPVADAARRVVSEIKEKEAPNFIICLSHTGTEDGKGEDYELAQAVDGIDLIVSGHTHTTLETPIEVNGTFIVSCGPYTRNLGKITLSKTAGAATGSCAALEYELIPIDRSIPSDPGMEELAQSFKDLVNENYLAGYGLTYDQVLANSATDFTIPQTGDLIGEAYIATIKEIEGENYDPIAFAVAPDGVIRDRIRTGPVTTANAFDILSLGVGADGTPAYPLVSVYLTGKDLKNAFEVDASVSALMPAATLYGAGSYWRYNPNRMFLDRVAECQVTTQDGNIAGSIIDDKLYRVVADLYSGQMLATVKEKSFGLLSITPRNADGTEVTDFEDCIIHDNQGNEVKAWYALARYLQAAGEDLTPGPASKRSDPSWNPLELLFPMGLPTLVVTLVALAIFALAAFIVYRIVTRKQRKARKAAKRAGK